MAHIRQHDFQTHHGQRRHAYRSLAAGVLCGLALSALAWAVAELCGYSPGLTVLSVFAPLGALAGAAAAERHVTLKKRRSGNVLPVPPLLRAVADAEKVKPVIFDRDISKPPAMIVDAVVDIKNAEAHFRDNLSPETMRRLLLSIDHTSSIGH